MYIFIWKLLLKKNKKIYYFCNWSKHFSADFVKVAFPVSKVTLLATLFLTDVVKSVFYVFNGTFWLAFFSRNTSSDSDFFWILREVFSDRCEKNLILRIKGNILTEQCSMKNFKKLKDFEWKCLSLCSHNQLSTWQVEYAEWKDFLWKY